MPQKEKKQNLSGGKRFRAVTEEVRPMPRQPQAPEMEEPPVHETKASSLLQQREDAKSEEKTLKLVQGSGVTETNNIVPTNEKNVSKKNIFLFFGVMFLVALIVMALAGGLYVYLNGVKNLSSLPTSSESPSPTYVPSPTPLASPLSVSPSPKPDYSLFNVSVLNGSGAIGAATAVRDLVQKGGFKVGYTGNAGSFNFTDTVIQVKNTVSPDVVAALKDLLVPTYSVKIGDQLSPQQRFDIIITVGSK